MNDNDTDDDRDPFCSQCGQQLPDTENAEDASWNEIIGREFFRGMRNGAVMGFAIGFPVAWLLLLVLGAP